MSIKVKHEGNATPGTFAAAAGGQGKRAQQDAAQMSQVMQSAANAGNQQLRGATAPGVAPGHTTAQLVHAPAPAAGNAGTSGTRGGGGSGGRVGSGGGTDPYEQRKLLEQKYGYDKELKKMGIEGDLAKISRQASENRGTNTWAARTEQAQHPDVPEQPNAGVQAPGQEGQGLSPLKPLNPTDQNQAKPANTKNPVPVSQETVNAVNDAFGPLFLLNQQVGQEGTVLGDAVQPSSFQQQLNQIVASSVNKLNRGINPSESDKNDDLLSKLVSQLSGQSVGRQKLDDNSVVDKNGVVRPYDNQSSDAGNRVSAYTQDSDYGFMDKIFSII